MVYDGYDGNKISMKTETSNMSNTRNIDGKCCSKYIHCIKVQITSYCTALCEWEENVHGKNVISFIKT